MQQQQQQQQQEGENVEKKTWGWNGRHRWMGCNEKTQYKNIEDVYVNRCHAASKTVYQPVTNSSVTR